MFEAWIAKRKVAAASGRLNRHAVVIGASIGGLLAARVLADSYEQVTVLERDAFPEPGLNRKGVPHGRHAHQLLPSGREILESFFPGLTAELAAKGAIVYRGTEGIRLFQGGGYLSPVAGKEVEKYLGVAVGRPLLEASVRSRLLALPNVRIMERSDVLGVTVNEDNSRITGVRLSRRQSDSAEEALQADLVVDASGRGSRTPSWLKDLGYPAPQEEQVRVGIGYTTRLYQRKPEPMGGLIMMSVAPSPEQPRGGVIHAQEDNRWIVTLFAYLGEQPPADEPGFLAFAHSLPTPDIYQVIRDAQPLGAPVQFRYPANRRRYYENLARFPRGFLVFGDALCSFNPIYGQGMSVAALEAVALHESLAQGAEQLAQRFFRRASKVIDIPWQIATGGDLRIPGVAGRRNPLARILNGYVSRLNVAAWHDPAVTMAFLLVANLIAPPSSLIHPRIAWRVLWGNLRSSGHRDLTANEPGAEVYHLRQRRLRSQPLP